MTILKRFYQLRFTRFPSVLLIVFAIVSFCFFGIEKYNNEEWSRSIASDGKGYYAYLPAAFIYHDFHYGFIEEIEQTYFKDDIQPSLSRLEDGRLINKYYIGTSLLITPFFLTAWFLSEVFLDFPPDGYSDPFNAAVNFAALFYALLGLYFLIKVFRYYNFSESIQALIITALFFGTNLLYYVWSEPSMSHAYSFFAFSLFIFGIKKLQQNYSAKNLFIVFISFGLIIVIRPINGLVILFAPFLLGGFSELKIFTKQLFKHPLTLIVACLLFAVPIFLQLFTYYLQTGDWLVWAYGNEGFHFSEPNIMNILFSIRKGWFVYTPFMFLCFVSILFLMTKKLYEGLAFFCAILFVIYVLSSWHQWFYGGGYSCRALIEYSTLMVIPFGTFISNSKNTLSKALIVFSSSCFILLNLVQIYQYNNSILPYDNTNWYVYKRIFLNTGPQFYIPLEEKKMIPIPPDYKMVFESFNDFEKKTDWGNLHTINTEQKYSGNHSTMAFKDMPFSACFSKELDFMVTNYKSKNLILEVSMMGYKYNNTRATIVITLERENKCSYYNGQYLNPIIEHKKVWQQLVFRYELPPIEDPETQLKFFILSEDKRKFYVDDVRIKLFAKNP